MNNFLLFGGEQYDKAGGWADFLKSYSTKEEAVSAARSMIGEYVLTSRDVEEGCDGTHIEWWHVVDLSEQKTVASCWDDEFDRETTEKGSHFDQTKVITLT